MLNRALDEVLDQGRGKEVWTEHLKKQRRISQVGRTLLVDFGDNRRRFLSFVKSGLGHAVYTRYDHMLFLMENIRKHIAPETSDYRAPDDGSFVSDSKRL